MQLAFILFRWRYYALKITSTRVRLFALIILLAVVLILGLIMKPKNIDNYVQYDCDVKVLRFSTDIEISSNKQDIGSVTGNVFRFVEDPLTMKDSSGNKLAYAGDEYHLVAQDSHAIIVGNTVTAEMVGLWDLFGNSYDIYNTDGKKIAHAEFNLLNTAGELYNADGKLIATYGSFVFFRDFTVKVAKECELDPTTVLMIFCSYYSDQAFDNR